MPTNVANAGSAGFLNSISCASPGNCGALVAGEHLLTETADSWSTGVDPPLPANGVGGLLYSVSCDPAGDCSAVGEYTDTSGDGPGLLIGGRPAKVKVDISEAGTGTGTVSSAPSGIDCGSTCSASFDAGTSLTLTATPSPGSGFIGWSGGGCTGTGTCQVNTGISEQAITARFSLPVKVVVSKDGNGSGVVSSVPAGIHCGSTCSASFTAGSSLTLIATPSRGSRFTGWSSDGCSGTRRNCELTDVSAEQAVFGHLQAAPKMCRAQTEGQACEGRRARHQNQQLHGRQDHVRHLPDDREETRDLSEAQRGQTAEPRNKGEPDRQQGTTLGLAPFRRSSSGARRGARRAAARAPAGAATQP